MVRQCGAWSFSPSAAAIGGTGGNGYPGRGRTPPSSFLCLLHGCGYVGYYGGNPQKSFIWRMSGTVRRPGKKYNGYTNSRNAYGAPLVAPDTGSESAGSRRSDGTLRKLVETHQLEYYDPEDYRNSSKGFLGEFVICNGSGWTSALTMCFQRQLFRIPICRTATWYRVQFTLSYGHDIGGAGASGGTPGVGGGTGSYYTIANKDRLTALLAQALRSPAGSTSGCGTPAGRRRRRRCRSTPPRAGWTPRALRAALDKAAVSSSAAGPSPTAVPCILAAPRPARQQGILRLPMKPAGRGTPPVRRERGRKPVQRGRTGKRKRRNRRRNAEKRGGTALSASSAASTGSLRPTSGRSGGPGWIFWLVGGLLVCAAALYILSMPAGPARDREKERRE